jgi:hypothetical protein
VTFAPSLLVLFELQDPKAVQRLHGERAGWCDSADVEKVDIDHAALIIRPGAAVRLVG